MANTTRFMIEIPDVGADSDMWGNILNNYFNALEAKVFDRVTGDTTPFVNGATTLRLQTGGVDRVTVDAAGNVGVGTGTVSPIFGRTLQIGAGTTENSVSLVGPTGAGFIATLGNTLQVTARGGTSLSLGTNDVERARITSGGNLLVGTTVDTGGFRLQTNNNNGLVVQNAAGDAAAAIFGASSSTALNSSGNSAVILGQDGIIFGTSLTGERARITSGGYFKASNNGSYKNVIANFHEIRSDQNLATLYVTSTNIGSAVECVTAELPTGATGVLFAGNETGVATRYRVLANGNVQNTNNSYGAISDIKLKENITDATPKLDSLNRLRVVNYNLIGSELKQIGLIAQEVEQVFPALVESTPDVDPDTKEPTGTVTKAVKYSVLVPMLLKAVQELSARVAELEAK